MRTFALLDENNIVINISVADDSWDSTGWIEYTDRTVSIGWTYNLDEDIFIAPQPFKSWTREGSYWYAPIPKPDGINWIWDEELGDWVEAVAL
jgi:hypothetical protein